MPSGGQGDLHGMREGREGAARHRIAISTSGEHRTAAAEGASRGENRPFGPLRALRDPPIPGRYGYASYGKHKVADR